MPPVQVSTRRPTAALVAAVLGIVGAAVPGLFALIVLALYEGQGHALEKWLWFLPFAALAAALVVGAVLLLRGRSWLALAAPAVTVGLLVLAGRLAGGGGARLYGVVPLVVPLAAAVLASRPTVRGWVRTRRSA